VAITDTKPVLDYLLEVCPQRNIRLDLIGGRTPEGQQIVQGFGGLVGIRRYVLASEDMEDADEAMEWPSDEDEQVPE